MHREYKRIAEHPDKAILLIHGIVGTPNHFNSLLPIIPDTMSVYNVLLDGHGKGAKDFSQTSMKKWETQIAVAVSELALNHNEIYIVAHSLGSLLAIEQAASNPKVSRLFLLAVPLKLFLKPKMFVNSFKVYFNKIDPTDAEALAAKACYGIDNDKNLLHYLGWIPRFLELFSKIRKTRDLIGSVSIPCIACQSSKDEMVSGKSAILLAENPNISVTELKNSGHYYYHKDDFVVLKEAFEAFLQ